MVETGLVMLTSRQSWGRKYVYMASFLLGKKSKKKKLTSVSFMYVCVAENVELLVFFTFFAPSP